MAKDHEGAKARRAFGRTACPCSVGAGLPAADISGDHRQDRSPARPLAVALNEELAPWMTTKRWRSSPPSSWQSCCWAWSSWRVSGGIAWRACS